ncbi:hypothetical protein BH10ACT10_BH10ACT10_24270 [soil metagenome]
MVWVLVMAALAGAGGGAEAVRRLARRRQRADDDATEMSGVRAMADEDTTLLGEQLTRIGVDHPAEQMDEATRVDYQSALDAYEAAKRAVPRLSSPPEVSQVVDILSTGRYALACVHARLEGRPVPERRVPCFFNPQHGPSLKDVRWTDARWGTRVVPACAQDAARVAKGEAPEIRRVGRYQVPYWESGDAFLPYGRNYYSASMLQISYQRTVDTSGGG